MTVLLEARKISTALADKRIEPDRLWSKQKKKTEG